MKIRIIKEQIQIDILLDDNPTAKSLYSQLPTEVDIEDYASKEKIFYPSKKLSKDLAPAGYEPKAGDVTYYAPWGNVAIFYEKFSYSNGLIYLGKIDGDLNDLKSLKGKVRLVKID